MTRMQAGPRQRGSTTGSAICGSPIRDNGTTRVRHSVGVGGLSVFSPSLRAVWSKPVFFAFRVLGAELVSIELGPSQVPGDEKPGIEGGPGGSHEIGFVMGPDPVVVRGDRQ